MIPTIIIWLSAFVAFAVPAPSSRPEGSTPGFINSGRRSTDGGVRILKPAVHEDTDIFAHHHIEPFQAGEERTLFFDEDPHPTRETYRAHASYNFTGHTVVIDHSAYLSAYADSTGHLSIDFSTDAAYDVAAASWPSATGLIFIGHIPGCGNYAGHELCYFKVASLTFDEASLSCAVGGSETQVVDIITDWEIRWDLYTPGTTSHRLRTRQTDTTSCTPPPDTKYNLPTACIGPNFDQQLDDALGTVDWKQNGWYDQLDGINEEITADDDTEFLPSAPIRKRIFGKIGSWVKSAANTVTVGVNQVKQVVVDVAKQIPIKGVTQPVELSKDFSEFVPILTRTLATNHI